MGRTAFTEHSYDEVSIDELAKKAKISKGLFYYYFPTKRDLYIAALQHQGVLKPEEDDDQDMPADAGPAPVVDLPPDPFATAPTS